MSLSSMPLIDGRLVGATLIHADLFRNVVVAHGYFKEVHGGCPVPLCAQAKMGHLVFFVHRTIQVCPAPFGRWKS